MYFDCFLKHVLATLSFFYWLPPITAVCAIGWLVWPISLKYTLFSRSLTFLKHFSRSFLGLCILIRSVNHECLEEMAKDSEDWTTLRYFKRHLGPDQKTRQQRQTRTCNTDITCFCCNRLCSLIIGRITSERNKRKWRRKASINSNSSKPALWNIKPLFSICMGRFKVIWDLVMTLFQNPDTVF